MEALSSLQFSNAMQEANEKKEELEKFKTYVSSRCEFGEVISQANNLLCGCLEKSDEHYVSSILAKARACIKVSLMAIQCLGARNFDEALAYSEVMMKDFPQSQHAREIQAMATAAKKFKLNVDSLLVKPNDTRSLLILNRQMDCGQFRWTHILKDPQEIKTQEGQTKIQVLFATVLAAFQQIITRNYNFALVFTGKLKSSIPHDQQTLEIDVMAKAALEISGANNNDNKAKS